MSWLFINRRFAAIRSSYSAPANYGLSWLIMASYGLSCTGKAWYSLLWLVIACYGLLWVGLLWIVVTRYGLLWLPMVFLGLL